MSSSSSVFELEVNLPTAYLKNRAKKLLGFNERYSRIQKQLEILLRPDDLKNWCESFHGKQLNLLEILSDQYPFAIFYGDVGTGKTANAEAIANALVVDAKIEDAVLFKLSNKVRGSGRVGEMGTLISHAFDEITSAIGGGDARAILIIDEGDSLGASRTQEHSHHEDKVGVNTLIQAIDNIRQYQGRIFVILCTNRLDSIDAALHRRALIVEEFVRPSRNELRELLSLDLSELNFTKDEIAELLSSIMENDDSPRWSYSDVRTRLYPSAIALAYPGSALKIEHLCEAAKVISPSPVMIKA